MYKLTELLEKFEHYLVGKPKRGRIMLLSMGIGTYGVGSDLRRVKEDYEALAVELMRVICDYKKINPEFTASSTLNRFIEGEVLYDYKCNRLKEVQDAIDELKKESTTLLNALQR